MTTISKAEFVKKLATFYNENVEPDFGIASMEYRAEQYGEFVYVRFKSNSLKRFCVTGDSNKGILGDFVKFVQDHDRYQWIF